MKVAVFGCGRMGVRHLEIVRDLGWNTVGILDPNPDAMARVGQQFEIAASRQHHDPRVLMDEAQPECVIVATTSPGHAPLTCLAAQMGARYILCEKPMARSLAECDQMITTCTNHGTRLGINHPTRFMPMHLAAKQMLFSEAFGAWTSITVVAGNMGVAMNGVHYFELLRWLSGENPSAVAAWLAEDTTPNPRGAQFHDVSGAIRVTTPSGKRLYMDLGADQGHGIRTVYAGRTGMLVVDDLSGKMELAVREPGQREQPTARYALASDEHSVESAAADAVAPSRMVLEALIRDGDYPTGENGRIAVATLVAAHVSNRQGHQTISTNGALPRDLVFHYP